MVACIGPLATVNCEPRQAWKGAAAAVVPCAGVWWVWVASIYCYSCDLWFVRLTASKVWPQEMPVVLIYDLQTACFFLVIEQIREHRNNNCLTWWHFVGMVL